MDEIKPPPLATSAAADPGYEDLDIVIAGDGDLKSSLDPWRSILKKYHLIIVSTDKDPKALQLGDLDHRFLTVADLSKCLPSALQISTRRYLAFVDLKSATPASDPVTGEPLDPFHQHLINLRSPSTPFFFNTLYDPFRPGTDFVRGYPFSLRTGVPTAISHGLWVNPHKGHFVDLVLTIPRNTFFPMRSLNVAFDRELIGPALFFGAFQDAALGDLWAGLCAKKICDHLGLGIKSGLPYVQEKSVVSGEEEESSIAAEVVGFFESLQMPRSAASAADCYAEILQQVKVMNPKFVAELRLDALGEWSSEWKSKSG